MPASKRILIRIINFLYRWLPIACGCHCRADRSFFFREFQFPVCARCTGEVIGFLFGLISFGFFHPSPVALGFMLLPLIIDGCVQMWSRYESNNLRRLWTGILFGYAAIELFLLSAYAAFCLGKQLAENLK